MRLVKGICKATAVIAVAVSLGGCFGDISDLSERVESAEARLAALEERLQQVNEKVAIVAGDKGYSVSGSDDGNISSMFGKPAE